MKKIKFPPKNVVVLLFIIAISFSCRNFKNSISEDEIPVTSTTDDYTLLRAPCLTTQRIEEDLSGKVIILTEKDFIEKITTIDNSKGFQYLGRTPCIVELYAGWCKPCVYQSQVLNELASEYQGKVIFYKLNVDKAFAVRDAFNVTSIPMILYFKIHTEVKTTVGFLSREKLLNTIDELLLNL